MTVIAQGVPFTVHKGVHERTEGNPGGPSRTKAVAAVIIVDVSERREQGRESRAHERRRRPRLRGGPWSARTLTGLHRVSS